jgi:sulfur-oxidizing protein SoxX
MNRYGCIVVSTLAAMVSAASSQTPSLPGTLPLRRTDIMMNNGIATIPAPLMSKKGDAAEGKKVVADRRLGNCLACHQVTALAGEEFHGELGASLDGVARRWAEPTLRMIIANPKQVFGDDTLMPAFYRIEGLDRVRPEFAGKPILTAQQVEDVVAYLATLK